MSRTNKTPKPSTSRAVWLGATAVEIEVVPPILSWWPSCVQALCIVGWVRCIHPSGIDCSTQLPRTRSRYRCVCRSYHGGGVCRVCNHGGGASLTRKHGTSSSNDTAHPSPATSGKWVLRRINHSRTHTGEISITKGDRSASCSSTNVCVNTMFFPPLISDSFIAKGYISPEKENPVTLTYVGRPWEIPAKP